MGAWCAAGESRQHSAVKSRRDEYQANWRKNLLHLLPVDKRRDFEEAWETAVGLLERALQE